MGTNGKVFTEFSELFRAGEMERACRTYMHPDLEIHEPPSLPQGGVFRGWDAPIRITKIYTSIWDIEVGPLEMCEAGDLLIWRAMFTWKSKKTGKSVTAPAVEVNYFQDGKTVRMEVFHHDTQGMLDTLK
jgi:hypothetical protein